MSVGNRVKYKIGTFSRNRACIGAGTDHQARYFFLQYLYWYENVVPGGFLQKLYTQITHGYPILVPGYQGYLCLGTVSRTSGYWCRLKFVLNYISRHLIPDRNSFWVRKNPGSGSVLIECTESVLDRGTCGTTSKYCVERSHFWNTARRCRSSCRQRLVWCSSARQWP